MEDVARTVLRSLPLEKHYRKRETQEKASILPFQSYGTLENLSEEAFKSAVT